MLAAFLFEWIKHENDENENDWRYRRNDWSRKIRRLREEEPGQKVLDISNPKTLQINASWTYPRLYTRATMVVKSFDA